MFRKLDAVSASAANIVIKYVLEIEPRQSWNNPLSESR